jgi:DNA-binding response OmpR family regulator
MIEYDDDPITIKNLDIHLLISGHVHYVIDANKNLAVILSETEYKILYYMVLRINRFVSRDDVLKFMYNTEEECFEEKEGSWRVCLYNLRNKISAIDKLQIITHDGYNLLVVRSIIDGRLKELDLDHSIHADKTISKNNIQFNPQWGIIKDISSGQLAYLTPLECKIVEIYISSYGMYVSNKKMYEEALYNCYDPINVLRVVIFQINKKIAQIDLKITAPFRRIKHRKISRQQEAQQAELPSLEESTRILNRSKKKIYDAPRKDNYDLFFGDFEDDII